MKITIEDSILNDLICSIKELKKEVESIKSKNPITKKYYNNEDLRNLLGINDKLIRKYRTEGLLSYSKIGDKFWYKDEDIEALIMNPQYRYVAFRVT